MARSGRARRGARHDPALLRGYVDEAKALLYQTPRAARLRAPRSGRATSCAAAPCVEAHTKIRHILQRVDSIVDSARQGGRSLGRALEIRDEIVAIEQETLRSL